MVRGVLVLLLLVGGAAFAQPTNTWGLKWNAPEGCVQAAELAELVERHVGRPLFAAQAKRHIDGYIALEASGATRARLTLLDDANRVLGTREFSTTPSNCRDLDQRVVMVISLLIQPFEPKPQPPPPAPRPPPDAPRLEVRGEERYANNVLVSEDGFYRLLGRRDLQRAMSARGNGKLAGYAAAGVALGLSAVMFLVAGLTPLGCTRFSGSSSIPGSCLEREPTWFIVAAVPAVVSLVAFIWAGSTSPYPTTQQEDEQLAKDFNAKQAAKKEAK